MTIKLKKRISKSEKQNKIINKLRTNMRTDVSWGKSSTSCRCFQCEMFAWLKHNVSRYWKGKIELLWLLNCWQSSHDADGSTRTDAVLFKSLVSWLWLSQLQSWLGWSPEVTDWVSLVGGALACSCSPLVVIQGELVLGDDENMKLSWMGKLESILSMEGIDCSPCG